MYVQENEKCWAWLPSGMWDEGRSIEKDVWEVEGGQVWKGLDSQGKEPDIFPKVIEGHFVDQA